MFALIKDEFEENSDDILNSINKILQKKKEDKKKREEDKEN